MSRAIAVAIAILAAAACGHGDDAAPASTPRTVVATPAAPVDAAPISRDDFAHLVLDRLSAGGVAADYDPKAFAITARGDAAGNVLTLDNVYAEYLAAPPADRPSMIDMFASLMIAPASHPKSLLMAKTRLFPLVRSGAYFDAVIAEVHAHPDSKPGADPVTRPLDELASIGIALDSDASLAILTARDLADWHTTWDEAMPIALDNLRRASTEGFDSPSRGVFVSPWHDTYDAARMLLPDVIGTLAVRGRPVALVPNRDTLIVTGDRDEAALLAAAALAETAYVPPRQIDLIARCWNGAWTPCIPDVTPAVARRYRAMHDRSWGELYAAQKEDLTARAAATGDDVFVASYVAATGPHGSSTTLAILTRGVPTLLPHADEIGFVDLDRPKGSQMRGLVRWDDAFALLGARWTALPMSPPRWRVESSGFPTDAELARLPQVSR